MELLKSNGERLLPFLKWAGGKRWLTESHSQLFVTEYKRFLEPFLGSGAVYFRLLPAQAILSDMNADLINTYTAIREEWKNVEAKLKSHHKQHSNEYYYKVRASKPRANSSRAARFIYLNRTCWNGLYRVNLRGEFNVPIGTKTNVILDTDDFEYTSKVLQSADLRACDFQETLEEASSGDLVFVDPPYTVKHNHNGFLKYNESIFTWDDQRRLKDSVVSAVARGAKVLVTNAYHASIRELYKGVGEQLVLNRSSVIAGSSSHRGRYEEIIIKCF